MAAADVLADSPLAFYRLDDLSGPTALDTSGNARDGTHVNDPIRLGCATSYDAISDDTEFGHASLALPLGAGAWEAYLWLNADDVYAVLRDHSGSPAGDNGWLLYADTSGGTSTGVVTYRVGGTEFTTDIPVSEVKDQTWRHFAITYDSTETRYFVDGALRWVGKGPGSAPSPGPAATPVALPWHVAKNGELSSFWELRCARVAFFDSKLSDARIAAHASGLRPCTSAGPTVGFIGFGAS